MLEFKYLIKRCLPIEVINIFGIFLRKKKCKNKLSFDIDISEHCNLNCKGCDHFSCIAAPSFADLNEFKADLKRIRLLFDNRVERINLLGGEPLLNPDIVEFCDVARNIFPLSPIYIVTNGILITQMPDIFYKKIGELDISLKITRYPIQFEYEKAVRFVHQKNPNINIEHMVKDGVVKTMYCLPIDITGRQNNRLSFRLCRKGNHCITLKEGKLFTCSFIPCIKTFNEYFGQNLLITDKDYIDIYKEDDPDYILKRLSKPFEVCRYCDNLHFRSGIPWSTTKGDIREWT